MQVSSQLVIRDGSRLTCVTEAGAVVTFLDRICDKICLYFASYMYWCLLFDLSVTGVWGYRYTCGDCLAIITANLVIIIIIFMIIIIVIMKGGFQLQDGAGPWQQLWGTQPNHQQMERPCPGTFFFLILFSLCLLTTSQHILSGANGEHWRHCGGCNDDQLCSRKCHRLHKAFHEPGHFYPFQGEKTLGKWVCCIVFYYTPISTAVCNTFVHTYCLEIGY